MPTAPRKPGCPSCVAFGWTYVAGYVVIAIADYGMPPLSVWIKAALACGWLIVWPKIAALWPQSRCRLPDESNG